jgi:hypothetical protein
MMLLTFDHDRCADLRARIQQITDGEYATAKRDVDALRAELGQPPLPGLQATLEDKSQQYVHTVPWHSFASWLTLTVIGGVIRYLQERRLGTDQNHKRAADESPCEGSQGSCGKRPRGRPKGSKNRVGKTPGSGGHGPELVPVAAT